MLLLRILIGFIISAITLLSINIICRATSQSAPLSLPILKISRFYFTTFVNEVELILLDDLTLLKVLVMEVMLKA